MKRFMIIMMAVLLVTSLSVAQDVSPMVSAGSKSLNFTFGGLGAFGLGPTGIGGGLGASYFLASDAAVRIGFQIANASSTIPANPAAGQTGTDGSQSAFTVGVAGDYLMYMTGASSRVRPYVGGGVQFGTASTNRKTAVISPAVQTEIKNSAGGETINGKTYFGGTSFGAVGIIGAEFFLYKEISLSAEYQLTLYSSTSAADQEVVTGGTTVTTKATSFSQLLGFGAAGAMLHIYF